MPANKVDIDFDMERERFAALFRDEKEKSLTFLYAYATGISKVLINRPETTNAGKVLQLRALYTALEDVMQSGGGSNV
ncbi:MAG: hypothetical protein ACK5JF_02660 [Oscillospiraceae bacterium]